MVPGYRSGTRAQVDDTSGPCDWLDAIRCKQKMNMSVFRRSRIAVESNAYCNFDHFSHA